MISLHNKFIKNKIQNNSKHIRFNNYLSFSPFIISNQYLNLYQSDLNVNCSSNLIINNIINLDTIFHLLHNYNTSLCNKQMSLVLNENLKQYSIISNILNSNNPLNNNNLL
ncbi:unnamed protein product [Schistosoma spindalis]|nr:unnamed protein product [Schistosoma spindale]